MADSDIIKFIINICISSLISGGTGILIVVFLSKKIIDHRLLKDIEKYKSELLCQLKFDQEVNKYNYDEETKVIKLLWDSIESLVNYCAIYNQDSSENELNQLNENLKKTLSKNKPFIYEDLSNLITELIESSNIEYYSAIKFNEIVVIRDEIIKTIRKRMHLF